MRKHTTPTAEGMGKSPYTTLIETLETGARIYAHTHPRISGAYVVVEPPASPGRVRTDWTAYKTLEQAQSATYAVYYPGRGSAGIGT